MIIIHRPGIRKAIFKRGGRGGRHGEEEEVVVFDGFLQPPVHSWGVHLCVHTRASLCTGVRVWVHACAFAAPRPFAEPHRLHGAGRGGVGTA